MIGILRGTVDVSVVFKELEALQIGEGRGEALVDRGGRWFNGSGPGDQEYCDRERGE